VSAEVAYEAAETELEVRRREEVDCGGERRWRFVNARAREKARAKRGAFLMEQGYNVSLVAHTLVVFIKVRSLRSLTCRKVWKAAIVIVIAIVIAIITLRLSINTLQEILNRLPANSLFYPPTLDPTSHGIVHALRLRSREQHQSQFVAY